MNYQIAESGKNVVILKIMAFCMTRLEAPDSSFLKCQKNVIMSKMLLQFSKITYLVKKILEDNGKTNPLILNNISRL